MRHQILQALRRCLGNAARDSLSQVGHLISSKQLLFLTDPVTPGSVFFLPHGTRVFNKLIRFMKHQQLKYGFDEVITPLIYKSKLWKTSGHWENYKEDMFTVEGNDKSKKEVNEADDHEHEYGLKPMNCPGHCLIFSKLERSYNELPIRMSDFLSLHRNESSGALSGLTRVRRFHQDDGHIFCELHQINQEITSTISMIKDTYNMFGISNDKIEFFLSTRPEKFMGDITTWNNAEAQLALVLDATAGKDNWHITEGDGAFYGPKIDVFIVDAFKKNHQVGTIQLDFQLPARFDLRYISSDGSRDNRPIMVHRAVFGSLERFFAILLDQYQGKWPFWINPRQAVVIPVSDKHAEAAKKVKSQLQGEIMNSETLAPLTGYNFFVDVDDKSETVGNRIKEAIRLGYSYIIMIGDKDIQEGTIAVRTRDDRTVTNMKVEELYKHFIELERSYK